MRNTRRQLANSGVASAAAIPEARLIKIKAVAPLSPKLQDGFLSSKQPRFGGLCFLRLEWMNHRGVEFCVGQAPEREDVWIWRFEVDGKVRTGKTLTKLRPMAIRRTQQAIDRELKKKSALMSDGKNR